MLGNTKDSSKFIGTKEFPELLDTDIKMYVPLFLFVSSLLSSLFVSCLPLPLSLPAFSLSSGHTTQINLMAQNFDSSITSPRSSPAYVKLMGFQTRSIW